MARRPSKPASTGPNKVLVILLVFFVLTNLATAIWVYTAYKEKDKWDTAAKDNLKKTEFADRTAEWNRFQRDELFAALGEPKFYEKPDAVKTWKENREAFLSGSKYKNEDGDVEFLAIMKKSLEKGLSSSLEKDLVDGFDAKDGRYKLKFLEVRGPLEVEVNRLQKQLTAEVKKSNELQQAFVALDKKQKEARDAIVKDFQKGNDAVIEARKKSSESMNDAIKQNEELRTQVQATDKKLADLTAESGFLIGNLTKDLKKQQELGKDPNRFASAEPHALLLDISTGKPLWDMPRAKIVRVEDSGKKIFIDRGSKDGVTPRLTFTVFAASVNGRPVGEMKATVEVIRVEDANMSLCKINTFYDADGREIAATDATPTRLFREGGGALKEGDLLFNLCWGTHVAIVGIIDFTGIEAKSPAAQMDHLTEFMRHLERMGIVIDAYTDLRDGKFIGDITNKTNYLIRGQTATKSKDGDEDARIKSINGIIKAARDQAQERGLYIISPENFAVVTGYRRPGSADAQQTFTFAPSRPASAPPTSADKSK